MELNYSKTIANSSVHTGVNHFRIFSYLFFFSYSLKKPGFYCVYCLISYFLIINILSFPCYEINYYEF